MKKKELKQVEDKIVQFFKNEDKILLLKNIIVSLDEKKEELEQKIKTLNLNFDIDIKGLSLNGMPSSNNGSSYFENSIMKQIENIENNIKNIDEDILNKKIEIERLEIHNTTIQSIIALLPQQDIVMLELRYIKNFSEVAIANNLNLSISQYHRNRNKVLENIYNMLIISGEIG